MIKRESRVLEKTKVLILINTCYVLKIGREEEGLRGVLLYARFLFFLVILAGALERPSSQSKNLGKQIISKRAKSDNPLSWWI